LRDAATNGRVLRDEGSTWRRFVETKFAEPEEPPWSDPAERERLSTLLRQWASADAQD
jgi:hypothetical protein